MSYDFWNNPLVVSAFRLKYRRSGPSQVLILYPLTLLVFGMGVPYFRPDLGREWPQIAFQILICVQALVSGLAAAVGTSASMKSEVARQTLDFQRITSLSPRQILLGKLLGESAMAFLLAISIFPLAFLCWMTAGFPFELLVLAFVNLATHILLSGATGLVQPLELRDNKNTEQVVWIASVPLGMPALVTLGMALFDRSYHYPLLVGLLCVYPFGQLVFAVVSFHVMERRLENPLNPAIAKSLSYCLLILIDLTALVFTHVGPASFGHRWAILALVHLIACATLISAVTPVRETTRSWVWRFRGRLPRLLDSWLGNRAENSMAVVTYAVFGAVLLILEVGLTLAQGDREEIAPEGMTPIYIAGVTVLLILVYGVAYQHFVYLLGKKGASAFTGFVFLFVFVPLMAAGILSAMTAQPTRLSNPREPAVEWLLSITPAAHFGQWLGRSEEQLHLAPLVLLYVSFLVGFWFVLRHSLRKLEEEVDRKLVSMGVTGKAPVLPAPERN